MKATIYKGFTYVHCLFVVTGIGVEEHRPCELLSWVSVRRPSVRTLAFHI